MRKRKLSAFIVVVLAAAMLVGVVIPLASAADETITFLNPLGKVDPPDNQPLAARLSTLSGASILPLYAADVGGQQAVAAITGRLQTQFGATILTAVSLGATSTLSTFGPKTDAQYDTWAASADAVVIGVVNENVAAWWIAYHAKQLEARGVPVVVVVNEQFKAALTAGAQDNGIAALRMSVVDTASYARAFVQGTTAATVQTYMSNNIFTATYVDDLAAALTAPVTAAEASTAPLPPSVFGDIGVDTLTVSGSTYDKAIEAFYDLSMELKFGDGLPLVIPEKELVDEMIAATDRTGDEILGKIKLRGGIVTVEKVAINAVMAGARPEHFNAILAAMEVLVSGWEDNKSFYHAMTSSDNYVIAMMISGPLVNELEVSHGRSYGYAGNEPSAVIGKAIELCVRNIGHSNNDNSAPRHDRVNDHTMWMMGEHYDMTRELGWETHSELIGFDYDSNSITMIGCTYSQAFATAGGERAVGYSTFTANANRPTLYVFTPEAARRIQAPTTQVIYGTTMGLGRTTKAAWQNSLAAATRYTAWPIIAGKNPTNGRSFYNTMYGLTAFQTQLISGTIIGPSAPQDFKVAHSADGEAVTLSWSEPARADDLVKYQVSKDDGVTWTDVPLTQTTYTFGSLTYGAQYRFAVRAVNDIFNAAEIGGSGTTGDPNVVSDRASGRGAWAYEATRALPPTVYITGPSTVVAGAGATATYTVSVEKIPDITAVQLTLKVDGKFFETKASAGLNGFSSVGAIEWVDIGGGIYEGTIVLAASTSASGNFDVFEVEFNLRGELGTTLVELVDFKVAYEGAWVDCLYGDMIVETNIEKWYSVYDLNRDDVVDLRDISVAMMYYMAQAGDANWDTAKVADVNGDGVVDIEDLILIRANFT